MELDLLANCIESGRPVDRGLPRTDDAVLLCDLVEPERCGFMWKSSGAGSVGEESSRLDRGDDEWTVEYSAGVRVSDVRVERASASSS